jgi:hypothetical protein
MKIRKGFVSNSSSSSFICDICGEEVSGMDIDLAEMEMYECENGHVFCEAHLDDDYDELEAIREYILNCAYLMKEKTEEEKKEIKNLEKDELVEKYEDYFCEMRYEFPSKFCPLCTLKHITKDTLLQYILSENNKTKQEAEEEMRRKYSNEKQFFNSI